MGKHKANVNWGVFYHNNWSVLSKGSRSQRRRKDWETIEEPRHGDMDQKWKGVPKDTTEDRDLDGNIILRSMP